MVFSPEASGAEIVTICPIKVGIFLGIFERTGSLVKGPVYR